MEELFWRIRPPVSGTKRPIPTPNFLTRPSIFRYA